MTQERGHWSGRYVGRPYILGVFDCADLARAVQKEVFGRDVKLPQDRDYKVAGSGLGPRERFSLMSQQIDRCKDDVARKTNTPIDGDAVLLIARGHRQHIGIFCFICGERWVLHASDGSNQVVLQRERDLNIRGLRVEGYYRWI